MTKGGGNHVTLFREVWRWTGREEKLYSSLCTGRVLHLFSGKSTLGDERIDIEQFAEVTRTLDLTKLPLPFEDQSFDTIIMDPPWVGPPTWHLWEDLIYELVRITRKRIIFILGNLFYLVPRPFKLKASYMVKKASPQVKLVHVWEKEEDSIS